MTDERRREQLYIFISRLKAEPPTTAIAPDELARQHHAYLHELQRARVLVGSGPARDESGARHGGGVIIIRAASLADAQAIAEREPYCREGQRAVEIIAWQRTWWDD